MRPDDLLTHDFFAARLGQRFVIELAAGRVELVLSTVTALPPPRQILSSGEERRIPEDSARAQPFTLLFTGPAAPLLPQHTYTLRIDGQTIDIFIVPVGKRNDSYLYEAVFG